MKRSGPLKRRKELRRTNGPRTKIKPDSPVHFSDDVRKRVRWRSGNRCEAKTAKCIGAATHFHHRLLRSQGGMGTYENCLHVCSVCHTYIHKHPSESYIRGWMISRAGQP